MRSLITYFPSFIWNMTICYPLLLLLIILRIIKAPRYDFGCGVITAEWQSWIVNCFSRLISARMKISAISIGHIIIYWPKYRDNIAGISNSLESHENVHIHQLENHMWLSMIVGLVVALVTWNWWLGISIWWSGGLWRIPNFITAVLRYGWRNIYWGAEHEKSAYAQTSSQYNHLVGKSWGEMWRKEKLR